MHTQRLYYTDSNKIAFKAKIVEVRQEDKKFITILNKTAFYPTSGGQQHDIGLLNNVEVLDVIDGDEILHVTESHVGNVNDIVAGQIDFDRRHKNKQQHTAQHILSQTFYRLFNFTTMSVHLGDTYGNIELDTKELSQEQIQKAEILSNQVISENRNVKPILVHSDNVSKYNLRKPPQREGEIRLIDIDDFECTACGGTHVSSTSEILLIKIISTEKIRGRIAINFLCGQQALQDYMKRFQVTDSIAKQLTCNVQDIETHFEKLIEQNKSLKRDLATSQKALIPTIIDELVAQAEELSGQKIIFAIENRFDKNLINQFALDLAEKCSGIVVLLYKDKVILSCSKETDLHAGDIAKKVSLVTQLKGGGNMKLAQLGGATQDAFELYKDKIREIITQGSDAK